MFGGRWVGLGVERGIPVVQPRLSIHRGATFRYPTVTTWPLARLAGTLILRCMWRFWCAVVLLLAAWAWARVKRGYAVDEGEAVAQLLRSGPGSL